MAVHEANPAFNRASLVFVLFKQRLDMVWDERNRMFLSSLLQ